MSVSANGGGQEGARADGSPRRLALVYSRCVSEGAWLNSSISSSAAARWSTAPARRHGAATRRARRAHRGDGRRDGHGRARRRRRRRRRRARIRRHPHALRRAGVLGPHAVHLAVARRDDGGDGQLRLRHRADASGPPRPDPAHAGERRGHVARRHPRRHRRASGRSRPSRNTSTPSSGAAPRSTSERWSATRRSASTSWARSRPSATATADEIAQHARASSARGCAPARSASPPRSRRRTSATPAGRCRAAPRRLPEIEALADVPRRGRARRHAGHARPGLLPRRVRRHPAPHAASRSVGRRCSAACSAPDGHRYVLERSAALQADGVRVIPQVSCRPLNFEFQFRAPFPFESMSLFKPRLAGRLRRQEAHLRRPGVPSSALQASGWTAACLPAASRT